MSTNMSAAVENIRESHVRSILKGISWRIIATLTTVLIAWRTTGEVKTALIVGAIEFPSKFLIYYFHERAWQSVPRGHVRQWFKRKKV
jgi:uncharacterized membrane protein